MIWNETVYDAENRLTTVIQRSTTVASFSFTYDGDGNRVKKVEGGTTTYYVGGYYEKQGSTITKYYYAGGQRIAMRKAGVVYYLHGDHLGSTSLTTNASGAEVARQLYYPYGEVRWSSGALPTDYTFTGQRVEAGLGGLMDYNARYYDPYLNRFISPDTIIPDPANPQDLNRYSYARNNPLRYTDPTGHIANNPNELTRADEILQTLLSDYSVTIDKDWGMLGIGSAWNPGSWELAELETVLKGVHDLAKLMGGAKQFRDNLGGVQMMRKAMGNTGEALAHKVWLRSIGSGGFSGQWEGVWTVVHELAHAWDAVNNWRFSRGLEKHTGGRTTRRHGYDYGGTPPKGADANFTRGEDWAESVATFVYPGTAQAFIQSVYANDPNLPKFQYANYYNLPRAVFVAQQVNMDPQQLLFLQENRW